MATTRVCTSFKKEALDGIHLAGDSYKLALFTASMDTDTTVYNRSSEASGSGYVAGGEKLSGRKSGNSGNSAFLTWGDVVWEKSTITAGFGLIYNADRGNRAVAVMDFGGSITSKDGTFTVAFPAATASSALIVIT